MAKSFLERVQPSRQRWKMVDWPFPVADSEERPRLKLTVLGQADTEAAYLAAFDHFKAAKRTITVTDPAFAVRERAELVFRAFSDEGSPIADDVDELVKQPTGVIDELYSTWLQLQNDVCAAPVTAKQMDELVDYLKKSGDAARLIALPSSWLIKLITTMASQLAPSTQANEPI